MNSVGEYALCPVFDNGAALLSDITSDYPLSADVMDLLGEVKAKTISRDFDEQLGVADKVIGNTVRFYFTRKDVDDVLDSATDYHREEIIKRVRTVLYQQMRKYSYLFD